MAYEFFLTDTLTRWGFWDFILPFILVFTIVYAVLYKINLFGTTNDAAGRQSASKFYAVIALVMGLGVVVPHVLGLYPPGKDIVEIFKGALPNVSAVIVAIVMAMLIIGVFGKKMVLESGNWWTGFITIAAFVIIVFIFGSSAGWWNVPDFLYWLTEDGDLQALIIAILVFGIIVGFITHEPKRGLHRLQNETDDAYNGRLRAHQERSKMHQLSKMLKD